MENISESEKGNSLITHSRILSFYYIFLGIIGFAMIMLPMIFYNTKKIDSIGTIGDAVGGILNPIIAIGAALLTFLAFYIQFEANRQVKKQFESQQFESQFYEMIRLHKENINEMKITGYHGVLARNFIRDTTGSITSIEESLSRETRFTEGRKVFVTMNTELIACYEILVIYDSIWSVKIPKKALFELAYQFFFFGSKSEVIWSKNKKARDNIERFRQVLNDIRDKHDNSMGGIINI